MFDTKYGFWTLTLVSDLKIISAAKDCDTFRRAAHRERRQRHKLNPTVMTSCFSKESAVK